MSSQQAALSTSESAKSEQEFFQSLVGEYKSLFDSKSENFMEVLSKEKEVAYKH